MDAVPQLKFEPAYTFAKAAKNFPYGSLAIIDALEQHSTLGHQRNPLRGGSLRGADSTALDMIPFTGGGLRGPKHNELYHHTHRVIDTATNAVDWIAKESFKYHPGVLAGKAIVGGINAALYGTLAGVDIYNSIYGQRPLERPYLYKDPAILPENDLSLEGEGNYSTRKQYVRANLLDMIHKGNSYNHAARGGIAQSMVSMPKQYKQPSIATPTGDVPFDYTSINTMPGPAWPGESPIVPGLATVPTNTMGGPLQPPPYQEPTGYITGPNGETVPIYTPGGVNNPDYYPKTEPNPYGARETFHDSYFDTTQPPHWWHDPF